jgi:hypothetical protein
MVRVDARWSEQCGVTARLDASTKASGRKIEVLNIQGQNMPVVPTTQLLHTKEHPFCGDPTCPCSEDTNALTELDQAIRDGLITPDDATRILQGKTV